jgi:predicted permease
MMIQDIHYAFRTLRQSWSVTVIAILSLALGIGANTAIFSLIDAVLLRSLPVKDPQQLVVLTDPDMQGMSIGLQSGVRTLLTYSEFTRLRDRNRVFSGLLAAQSETARLEESIAGAPKEQVRSKMVSGDYFRVLGVAPVIGRAFTEQGEGRALDSSPYAVISYEFWKRRFGLDPAVLGKRVQIYRTGFTIIGVMPPGFFGETVGSWPDMWLPLTMQHEMAPGREFLVQQPGHVEKVEWLQVIGRLKSGVTLKQAQANMNVLFPPIIAEDVKLSGMAADRPRDESIQLKEGSKGASSLSAQFSEPLLVLLGVVGLVLLIACANVANLLLARGMARRKEIGIRLALGAARGRLFRQLLTESMVLALAGGLAGVAFAGWADRILLAMASTGPETIPLRVGLDLPLLLFAAAVSMLTGLLFGIVPSLSAARTDVNPVLKENARGVTTGLEGRGRRLGLGKLLVAFQVALSLMLLIGAGLFVRSLVNLAHVQLGYEADHLLTIGVDPTPGGYKGAAVAGLYERLLARIGAIPGVRAVSLSSDGLFSGSESADRIWVEGYASKNRGDLHARFDEVGPGYFKTVGIPVLLGRDFGPQDSNGARVCLINQTMAKFYFGSRNPIGLHIRDDFPDTRTTFEIIGVVADAKYNSVREQTPRRFYVPYLHGMGDPTDGFLMVRTFANPAAVAGEARKAILAEAGTLDVNAARTVTTLVDESLTQDRLIARLSAAFGALALLLASIGLYGVMSFAISRRTSEIGLRMALGAGERQVMWMVVRESLWMMAAGIAVGIPAALAAARLIASRLYGLSAADPETLAGAASVLLAVALVAAIVPAVRAARVDPTVSLRYE